MKIKEVAKLTEENKGLQQHIARLNKNIQALKTRQGNKGEGNENAAPIKKKENPMLGAPGTDQNLLKMRKMPDTLTFRNLMIEDKKDISSFG